MTRCVALQALVTALTISCCFFLAVWAPMYVRPERARPVPRLRTSDFPVAVKPAQVRIARRKGVIMHWRCLICAVCVVRCLLSGAGSVQLTMWSSDFHIAPIADLKHLFATLDGGMRVRIIDKSLSAHCHMMGTCAEDLRVLTRENGLTLEPCPNELKLQFFLEYEHDPEMRGVDVFLCNHAAAMCEVFMPFNRPMIVLASTRYELGRHTADRWQEWNQNLQRIAEHPGSIVVANNAYDAEYIKYFTAIPEVPVVPSYCGYVDAVYNPRRAEILVGPARGVDDWLFEELQDAAARHGGYTFAKIRDLYPTYRYADLAAHPAMVILPYQVSFMSLFEAYRMAIPMFVPTPELLAHWHVTWGVLFERTWATVAGGPRDASPVRQHPRSRSRMKHDPNGELSYDAILEWIQLADFYQWPHITTFDSFVDLQHKLDRADLRAISLSMQRYNAELLQQVQKQWTDILARVASARALAQYSSVGGGSSYSAIMKQVFGVVPFVDMCTGQASSR